MNLGLGLAKEGKRVLMIDADPQGSLTISLGFRELYLVDVKKMKAYVGKFNYKVDIFDVDAIEEQAKIERRLQRYV